MRIRTIKPEFWTDEVIRRLPRNVRLLFIGTWNLADDEGRLQWTPELIKAALFPSDHYHNVTQITKDMRCLEQARLIVPYIDQRHGERLAQILNFKKHQRINRPRPSKLPKPDEQLTAVNHCSVTDEAVMHHHQEQGTGNKERKTNVQISDHSLRELEIDKQFQRFWSAYPRKQAKGDARKAYEQALKAKKASPAAIQAGAERYAAATATTERRYIKLPAGWLRDERWLDEVAGNGSGNAHSARMDEIAAQLAGLSEEEERRRRELGVDDVH